MRSDFCSVQFPAPDSQSLLDTEPGPVALDQTDGLLSPFLPDMESSLDLEEQWQDLMSIMDMQVLDFALAHCQLISTCLSCYSEYKKYPSLDFYQLTAHVIYRVPMGLYHGTGTVLSPKAILQGKTTCARGNMVPLIYVRFFINLK